MTSDHDAVRLRRYILGTATEDECAVIERDYFERTDALDHVSEVEDDLIADYLSQRLTSDERDRFERHYLTTPGHRRRVEVMRAITTAAHARASTPRRTVSWWATAGVAAALVLAAGAGWLAVRSRSSSLTIAGGGPAPVAAPPASSGGERGATASAAQPESPRSVPAPSTAVPVVVAVSISPILIRGDDQPATLAIRPGTDIARLVLLGEARVPPLRQGRAVVRTVDGREIWRGPASRADGSATQEFARIEIPGPLVQQDDYIIQLFDGSVERYRYFLRVRTP